MGLNFQDTQAAVRNIVQNSARYFTDYNNSMQNLDASISNYNVIQFAHADAHTLTPPRASVPLDASNISVTKVSSLGVTVVGQELLFSICRPKCFFLGVFFGFLERGKDAKRLRAELTLI